MTRYRYGPDYDHVGSAFPAEGRAAFDLPFSTASSAPRSRRPIDRVHANEPACLGRVPEAIPLSSRKPGGRHRAGQRSAGRNPPNPKTPVDPRVILRVLERKWHTPSGWPNMYRVRSLAALAVALAVPPGTSSIELCAMRPSDVVRLKMPEAGWRWVRRWFRHRAVFVDGIRGELTSWLAIPPVSNGRPKQIAWAVTQTLARAEVPPWRIRCLLRSPWLTSSWLQCVPFR